MANNKRMRPMRRASSSTPEEQERRRAAAAGRTAFNKLETQKVVARLKAGGNGMTPLPDLCPMLVEVGSGPKALSEALEEAGVLTEDLRDMIAAFDMVGGLPNGGGGGGGGGGGDGDGDDADGCAEDEDSDDDNEEIKNEDDGADYRLYVPGQCARST
jgi:hypothetical protein